MIKRKITYFFGMKNNLLLLFTSLFVASVLMEYAVRIFHLAPTPISNIGYFQFIDNDKIIYKLLPGGKVDGDIVNIQGYRGKDFIKKKPSNTVRIAMLGDSVTQGLYIRYKDTFSAQLEHMLNCEAEKLNNQMRYDVMDFGVGGYNIEAEVETLRTAALVYSPDIVVLNFFPDDGQPFPGFFILADNDRYPEKEKKFFIKRYLSGRRNPFINLGRRFLYRSRLYLFISERVHALHAAQPFKENILSLRKRYGFWDEVFVRKTCLKIKKLQRQFNFKLIICLHPELLQEESGNCQKMAKLAQESSFFYIDMFGYYKQEAGNLFALRARQDDVSHINEKGHAIVAKVLFHELYKLGFLY